MSTSPYEEDKLVIQRTDVEPIDHRDTRSYWEKFIDALRTTIGLKPLYLAERWALAKVRQEEADADARLLAAKANYERAMAEARRLELEGEAAFAKGMAQADQIRIRNELLRRVSDPLVAQLINSVSEDPELAIDRLQDIISRIELHGGVVELDLPPRPDQDAANAPK